MPKLKSAHFSRVGHPSARIDGVTLHFTPKSDANGEPCDTVTFLRNGGGKTSFIQLLFSVFVPNKNEFAGKTSDGGERSLDQYFMPGELGLVVTEWSLGPGLPVRVVGQCVQKKTAGSTDLDRTFFSFTVGDKPEDVKSSDLPLRQFKSADNPGNASSPAAFLSNLRTQFQGRGHQELYVTTTQADWLESLRKWGFEPDLFRLLIQLNKNEGGSKQMAKSNFGSVELMIGLISTLTTKDSSADTVQKLINQHREALNGLRPLKLERDMWSTLNQGFQDLIVPGQELVDAQARLDEAKSDCNHVAAKVLATPAVLTASIAENEKEKSALTVLETEKEACLEMLSRQKNWLRQRSAEYTLASQKAALASALQAREKAAFESRALVGRNIQVEIDSLDQECQGFEKAIADASLPAAEMLASLHGIGGRLAGLYEEKEEVSIQRQTSAEDKLTKLETELKEHDLVISEKNKQIGQYEEQIKGLQGWFKEAEKHKVKLKTMGCLLPIDTSAQGAKARIEADLERVHGIIAAMTLEIAALGEERGVLSSRLGGCRARLEGETKALESHQGVLAAYLGDFQFISSNEDLCLLLEQPEIDPYTPGLAKEIERKAKRLFHDAFNLEIEQRRDREAQSILEGDYQLMPPQEDVWSVATALKARNIPAYPYVQYLSENNNSPEDIRNLLRQDPGRYGGVCVTTEKYLDQAREAASELPSLRGPVQISLLCREDIAPSPSATLSVVSLPQDDATFNTQAASRKGRLLELETSEREKKIQDFEKRAGALEAAKDLLIKFLGAHPAGKRDEIDAETGRTKVRIAELTTETGNHERELALIDQRLAKAKTEKENAEECLRNNERALADIQRYIENYKSLMSDKAAEEESARGRKTDLEQDRDALTWERGKRAENQKQSQAELIYATRSETEFKEKRAALTYSNRTAGTLTKEDRQADIAYLEARYNVLKDSYEKENQGVLALAERLSERKKTLGSKRGQLEKETIGIPAAILEQSREDYPDGVPPTALSMALGHAQQAERAVGGAEEQVKMAQEALAALAFAEEEMQAPPAGESPGSKEDCAVSIRSLDTDMNEVEVQKKMLSERIRELAARIETIHGDIRTLNTILGMAKAYSDMGGNGAPAQGYNSAMAAQEAWGQTGTKLKTAENHEKKAAGAVAQKVGQIIDTLQCEEYADIAVIQRRRILDNRKALHHDAAEFARDAQDRLASVEFTFNNIHQRKNEIVDYLLDDVRATSSHLSALGRISKLPENNTAWANWSGRSFFKVDVNTKKFEDGYGRARIEDYLDSIINARANALSSSAHHIIQGAAKSALRDITTITTMKPEHFASTHPFTLEEAAAWSGGEGLTYAAIALMSFNKLAAYIHSTTQKGGNFLLIDNPIGSCNHLSFIKLQRLMSKLLNVQLIYPTGIKDHEALSMFPNFIALSHDRQDRRTGYTYVEVDKADRGAAPANMSASHMTIEKELVDVF